MDTVSYLTINDETKEIADLTSRNTIEDIAAVVTTHDDDIEQMQLSIGPNGSLSLSVKEIKALAQSAQSGALSAEALAELVDEKADTMAQTIRDIQTYINNIEQTANYAWNRAGNAISAIETANQQTISATSAAGAAWLEAGNATGAASDAWDKANDAITAATAADDKAGLAITTANIAQANAEQANTNINNALIKLSTFESIIDTTNWFVNYSFVSTDTEVDSNKNYYSYDLGIGTISKVNPIGTESPREEGWYEIDETIQNYITSHTAQTNDGFYVLSTAAGWRILISTGEGNHVSGVFIIDSNGVIKQALTNENGITFDDSTPFTIGDENAYIVFDGNGHITIGGSGVSIDTTTTIGQSNKTLAEVLNDLSEAIVSIEYGKSDSNIDYSDIEEWSVETPEWESEKYIWMRTFNGTAYTYTCIQGAAGPQGETGPIGPTGPTGPAGMPGIGIESVTISYAMSDSDIVVPDDDAWVNSIYELNSIGTAGQSDGYDYNYYEEDNEENSEINEEEEEDDDEQVEVTGDLFTILDSLEQGSWLWIRTITNYSDGTSNVTYQKSYIGADGADTPSATVTIIPTEVNWDEGTAILAVRLTVNGEVIEPISYYWTKGISNETLIGTDDTLTIADLNATYNCTVEW